MSEMIGAKKNSAAGLSPEFEHNPYEKLDDMLFDEELEYIISVEDDYLKQALSQFLNDHNLRQKTKDFKSFEYMFISFDLGTFNFIEKPNYKDKRIYELPYDWSELMGELKNYLSEHKFEKHEIADKNPESWSVPREDTPGTQHSHNDGKSFLERAKAKLGMSSDDDERQSKVASLLEEMNNMSSKENENEYEDNTKGSNQSEFNSIDEIKSVLKESAVNDDNFKVWNEDGKFVNLKMTDGMDFDGSNFDSEHFDASPENPHKIASAHYSTNEITLYIEITEPFTKFKNDEFGATEHIEFDNGDNYVLTALTPAEQMSFEYMQEMRPVASNVVRKFDSINKLVDEFIV